MERIYKTMRNTGAASIAVGIVVASVGLAAGIIAIINGALLLKRKSHFNHKVHQIRCCPGDGILSVQKGTNRKLSDGNNNIESIRPRVCLE